MLIKPWRWLDPNATGGATGGGEAAAGGESASEAGQGEGEGASGGSAEGASEVPAEGSEDPPQVAEPQTWHESFDWVTWDGSYESLPEEHQAWAQRLSDWHEERMQSRANELDAKIEQYKAWMDGREDPRIPELSGKLDELQTKYSTLEAQLAEKDRELNETVTAVEQWRISEGQRRAAEFQRENDWIFDKGPIEKAAEELLNEGWTLATLPVVLKLDEAQQAEARKRFGNRPDIDESAAQELAGLVLEVVQGRTATQTKPKARNPSSEIVSGRKSTPSQAPRIESSELEPVSLSERKRQAAKRAVRRANRRG